MRWVYLKGAHGLERGGKEELGLAIQSPPHALSDSHCGEIMCVSY